MPLISIRARRRAVRVLLAVSIVGLIGVLAWYRPWQLFTEQKTAQKRAPNTVGVVVGTITPASPPHAQKSAPVIESAIAAPEEPVQRVETKEAPPAKLVEPNSKPKKTVRLVKPKHKAKPAAVKEGPWNGWNVAPYETSLSNACLTAPEAIDGFSMPLAVKEHFKRAVGTACRGGTEAWLTPHLVLQEMWSGPDAHHSKAHILPGRSVGELPVLRSPDGRSYRTGAVAQTAKALEWSYVYDGKTWLLDLPLVCFNLSWRFGPPALPALLARVPEPEECRTIAYSVRPGDLVRFAVNAREFLPSSACWQLCDGTVCTAPPSPCDNCDWIGPKPVIPVWFKPLHTGKYVAKSPRQTLRFPREVMGSYVALCDDRPGRGQSKAWVVPPSAWGSGITTVIVPYGGQEWPTWGPVDMSRWRQP